MINPSDVTVTRLPDFMNGISIEVPWTRGDAESGTIVVTVTEKSAITVSNMPVVSVKHKLAPVAEPTEYVGVLYGDFKTTRDALDYAEKASTIFTYRANTSLRLAPGDKVLAPVGVKGDPQTLSTRLATVVELDSIPDDRYFTRTITKRA